MEKKYEHAKFLIERFDHFYESTNTKGNLLLGLNSLILGGIFIGYTGFATKISQGLIFWVLLSLLFFSCIISLLLIVIALSPFTKDNASKDDNPSLIFFGGISRYSLNNFLDKIKALENIDVNEDMYKQVHCLAYGLNKKYKTLTKISYLLVFEFILIAFISLYFIQNYKP